MDRLTIEYYVECVPKGICSIDREVKVDNCPGCYDLCNGGSCKECPIQECFNKLSEYEDTGLTPEEIEDMLKTNIMIYEID